MRKGRIIKGLAFAITAVMLLGCFSASYTSARTQGWTDHIDIRTNAAFINDGNQSNVTITKDNITYVGYKTGNASQFTDLFKHNDKLSGGRDKYETKFGSEEYGADLFKVNDETAVVRIAGTYSNGEAFDVTIGQQDVYPDNTYIEYKNTSNGTESAMKSYGATVQKLTINGKKADYYNVSGCSILKVGVAMCNGVSFSGGKVVPCGIDLYISPKVIESFDELTVKKNWTNVEGSLIPSNVTVQLYKDGEAVEGKTAVLSADNDWTAVIKYTKEEGAEYTVKETAIDGVAVGNTAYTYTADVSTSYGSITFEDTKVALDTISLEKYYDGSYVWTYFVETLDNAFGVAKMKDKDVYVVWTYKDLPDSDKQLFIDAINAKGDISGLTMDNTEFRVGTDASPYEYDVTTQLGNQTASVASDDWWYSYDSESDATTAMNNKIASLTKNNSDTYNVTITNSKVTVSGNVSYGYQYSDSEKESKKWKNESDANNAMNQMIAELKEYYEYYGYAFNVTSNKVTKASSGNKKYGYEIYFTYQKVYDNRSWGYEINYTETKTEKRSLAFTYDDNFRFERENRNCKAEVFNFSNRADWDYLYDGRFTSESTPDETTIIVSNTYVDTSSITGSKTFDMQNQSDIAVPVNEDGTPKIDIDVYKNGVAVADTAYDIAWERVDNSNTWTFTITGDAITKYYDSDSNGKLDSVASYTVKEAGEEDGVINIDNFDYNVVYGDNNAITNTLDTSSFVGDLTINKTIDDVNPVNGKAIFTYKVEGEGKTYYAVIVVDSETKTGTTTLKGLKIGNYTVTELNTMRFAKTSVTPDGGAASVTRNGEATVDFTNELKVRTNFSHTDVTVNHFTKTADGISTKRDGDNETNNYETRTAIVAPAYR